MIIMAVDLGKARTGIAISDKGEGFAFPKDVITEYNTERLVERLSDKAKEYEAELIVAGLPKNMDGSLGSRAEECTEIAKALQEKSGIKTVMFDERCTTVQAYTMLNMNGSHGKKRREKIDAVAATIILEDFLRTRKNTEK